MSDVLVQEAQHIRKLEHLLAWSIDNNLGIHTMLQQDEFSTDIVLQSKDSWLVFDVT